MITSNKTYIPGLKVAPEMAVCSGLGPGHGDGGPLIWREGTGPEHNGKGSGPSTKGKVPVPCVSWVRFCTLQSVAACHLYGRSFGRDHLVINGKTVIPHENLFKQLKS